MVEFREAFDGVISTQNRYGFGRNWKKYIDCVDYGRIGIAEQALREMLDLDRLHGMTFLDIGSGSGLSSLAARRLGARVVSFDYDPNSVWCTAELKRRYHPNDTDWTVLRGSVIDPVFMGTLAEADIVYSWGVLHHTGDMYAAIRSAAQKVRAHGLFFVALYRKTILCPAWNIEKRFYCAAPERIRSLIRAAWIGKTRLSFRIKGRDFKSMVANYGLGNRRGMDYYRDVDDWLGGYPYESLTPRECRAFFEGLGFSLVRERAISQGVAMAISSGCDEWVFQRDR